MLIADAQGDVRRLYVGGFYGQLVSAVVWLLAASVAQWVSTEGAVIALFFGGSLIFPLTWLTIRLTGRPASLPPGHPMAALAMQIAFTVPIGLVVVLAMLAGRGELFFPASMVIVGAHYLPFVFLYGMRMFAYLSAALVLPGISILLWIPVPVALVGWATGAILVIFAFLLRAAADSLNDNGPAAAR
ncbi:hypothetical protein C6I20_06690 [Aeromicrobium sp. A1-2]|uniref:DUF7010 family protein n=1 Tax=Aeromicrobium sp. A1-2 TaxID=2107713 RepID=UPI000E50FA4A|nr:hypothetical protein [Aeromicrobium sp. A1-2]AXT84907.1 hypothetical protein C6I20_06690 [Aeromicrobium sp. A1-2]